MIVVDTNRKRRRSAGIFSPERRVHRPAIAGGPRDAWLLPFSLSGAKNATTPSVDVSLCAASAALLRRTPSVAYDLLTDSSNHCTRQRRSGPASRDLGRLGLGLGFRSAQPPLLSDEQRLPSTTTIVDRRAAEENRRCGLAGGVDEPLLVFTSPRDRSKAPSRTVRFSKLSGTGGVASLTQNMYQFAY